MPVAQFNPFERLDKPIMQAGGEAAAWGRWHQLSAEWDRCLEGVEDELVGSTEVRTVATAATPSGARQYLIVCAAFA